MKVLNVHTRELTADAPRVWELIESLGSRYDLLWPGRMWPPMILGAPIGIGAAGGHGPIRYFVEAFDEGRLVRFRFAKPRGFDGFHQFEIVPADDSRMLLRHSIDMRLRGLAMLFWPVFFRPLHNALMEDAMAKAQASLGFAPEVRRWSLWVRMLRWVTSFGRAKSQVQPRIRT